MDPEQPEPEGPEKGEPGYLPAAPQGYSQDPPSLGCSLGLDTLQTQSRKVPLPLPPCGACEHTSRSMQICSLTTRM